MILIIAIFVYASSMALANVSVFMFGPWVSPINAFVLIGLDLALRDWLHVRLKPYQMGALIVSAGLLTYAINPAVETVAIASVSAFCVSALTDWAVFARLRGSWLLRANGSNVAGAAVDSLIFPTIAFGVLMPHIVVMQFAAKVCGGVLWAYILSRSHREPNPQSP